MCWNGSCFTLLHLPPQVDLSKDDPCGDALRSQTQKKIEKSQRCAQSSQFTTYLRHISTYLRHVFTYANSNSKLFRKVPCLILILFIDLEKQFGSLRSWLTLVWSSFESHRHHGSVASCCFSFPESSFESFPSPAFRSFRPLPHWSDNEVVVAPIGFGTPKWCRPWPCTLQSKGVPLAIWDIMEHYGIIAGNAQKWEIRTSKMEQNCATWCNLHSFRLGSCVAKHS